MRNHKPAAALFMLAAALPALAGPKLTAEQVLDKHVDATGGRAAYERIKSTVTKATARLAAQGIGGPMEIYAKYPNKMLTVQTLSGIGETRQGYDGKVAWSKDPLQGLRKLSGPEAELVARGAVFNTQLNWRKAFPKVALLPDKKIGAATCYVVKLAPEVGQPLLQYFDQKTLYMVRMDMTFEGPQGKMAIETTIGDYRPVDGVKVPFSMRQKIGGAAEMVVTLNSVKNNVPVDDALFAMPKK